MAMPVGSGVDVGVGLGVGLGVAVGIEVAVAVGVALANGFGRLATELHDRLAVVSIRLNSNRETCNLRCIL
jgi:hypothetical protein